MAQQPAFDMKKENDSAAEGKKEVFDNYQGRTPFGKNQDHNTLAQHSAAMTMKVSNECLVVVPGSVFVMEH